MSEVTLGVGVQATDALAGAASRPLSTMCNGCRLTETVIGLRVNIVGARG